MRPDSRRAPVLTPGRVFLLLTGLVLLAAVLWLAITPADRGGRDEAVPGVACADGDGRDKTLGLFTTLPVYWNETARLSDYLAPDHESHWARAVLERCHTLRALDTLTAGNPRTGPEAQEDVAGLAGLDYLLMAQPRILTPAENVVLDDWVRAGGRVLLFADPMLTAHSIHPLGDQRRPADVVVLSPILARWGLRLVFDEGQLPGERVAAVAGARMPVDMTGALVAMPTGGREASCHPQNGGLWAQCRIGRGWVLILADAALLDEDGADRAMRIAGLTALLGKAFSD